MQNLEIESDSEPNRARAARALRNKEVFFKTKSLFGISRIKIKKFRAESEYGRVKDVADLDVRAQAQAFRKTKCPADVHIKQKKFRTRSGVARQISRTADWSKCKLVENISRKSRAAFTKAKVVQIAVEIRSVGRNFIEIAVVRRACSA